MHLGYIETELDYKESKNEAGMMGAKRGFEHVDAHGGGFVFSTQVTYRSSNGG